VVKFSKDTRTIQPGEYYVAIRGEHFDGHDFIRQAIAKGASGIIVDKDLSTLHVPSHIEIKRVNNTVDYLANMAHQRIAELNTEVIAVTGSVGKTTTKNAIATVLAQAFPIVVSRGNLNTLLGLSLTILNELTSKKQKLIVEMGTYQRGNLARICMAIPPSISVITNIHPVHLERMGTIENIALAKSELVEALSEQGIACLNCDDPLVRQMTSKCRGRVVLYGEHSEAEITPKYITTDIPLLGPYRVSVALAAFSVGYCLGMPADLINRGLTNLKPEKGRLVKLPGINGSEVLDDTYNASPASTLAALEVLKKQSANCRIAFLADMFELGHEEMAGHLQVLNAAIEVVDQLILVGPRMILAARQLSVLRNESVYAFETTDEALVSLQIGSVYQPGLGDVILVKGSASMRMERVVRLLLSPQVDVSNTLVRQEASWQVL
jgi:UDP-N-acetylmuramoyl-tripeptide--D-alanyl-D-alanine ligase